MAAFIDDPTLPAPWKKVKDSGTGYESPTLLPPPNPQIPLSDNRNKNKNNNNKHTKKQPEKVARGPRIDGVTLEKTPCSLTLFCLGFTHPELPDEQITPASEKVLRAEPL